MRYVFLLLLFKRIIFGFMTLTMKSLRLLFLFCYKILFVLDGGIFKRSCPRIVKTNYSEQFKKLEMKRIYFLLATMFLALSAVNNTQAQNERKAQFSFFYPIGSSGIIQLITVISFPLTLFMGLLVELMDLN